MRMQMLLAHMSSRLLTSALLIACAYGQSLSGKWSAARTLDNGEVSKTILELRQSGNELTGRVAMPGYVIEINGRVKGNHFDLFAPWDVERPFMEGSFVGMELHIGEGAQSLVAKPAGPDDVIQLPEYIAPPALRKVSYNGLAKTPPMGWNSWNLFESRIDEKTVREIADAMVTSGMRDAGYIYVNIDDTWEGVRTSCP
jgi:alpha-galactosidase